jgi:hypothetical protein
LKDQRRDRLRIVPPHLLGDTVEELERGDHPFEDRLGALERQRQHERGVGVRPGRDQKRHELETIRKVDVDVSEVGFETLTRQMAQRDECLTLVATTRADVTLELSIHTAVTLFVAEPTVDLGGGTPLLGRSIFVVGQDLVDDRVKRSQNRGRPLPRRRNGTSMSLLEDLSDRVSRVSELANTLLDRHPIAMGAPDGTVIIHRKHVLGLRANE